jgi:predicted RNA-binding Zn-ribbon protein involved in translation (DUF1610 family)
VVSNRLTDVIATSMATEQHDQEYGNRTITRVFILIGVLIGLGIFIIPNIEPGPKLSLTGWILAAVWCVTLVVGISWGTRLQRHYHCPKCGAKLPMLPLEAATKHQHRFHCQSCEVIWTTDVYSGD